LEAEPAGSFSLQAHVSPSEDPLKVKRAVEEVAGEASAVVEGKRIVLSSESLHLLGHLREQLRDRHVRSAARRLMLAGNEGEKTTLMLNRQAAAAGVVALCGTPEESPLGPIYLVIRAKKIEEAIDWLTAYEGG